MNEETAEAPKRRGRPPKPERIKAKVLWGNVWSSEGKHMKGEEYEFLAADFEALDKVDAVKVAK